MEKTTELYTIRFRCKKYVQRYLMLNYGCPCKGHPYLVDVRKDAVLKKMLLQAVKEPCVTKDKWLNTFEGKKRNAEIEFKIPKDLFIRHGWSLTATDETKLHSMLEARCLDLLLPFLSLQMSIRDDLTNATEEFYDWYGFSENSWPSASIYKIWSRNKSKINFQSMKQEFSHILTKFFMCNVSAKTDNLQGNLST